MKDAIEHKLDYRGIRLLKLTLDEDVIRLYRQMEDCSDAIKQRQKLRRGYSVNRDLCWLCERARMTW